MVGTDRHARAKAALAFVNGKVRDARARVAAIEAELKAAQYDLTQAETLADYATREALETGAAWEQSGPVAAQMQARAVSGGEFLVDPNDETWR